MNVAFIVTIRLDELGDLQGIALEINDAVENTGFEVLSVEPWARPTLAQGASPLQAVPTTQQQTNETEING